MNETVIITNLENQLKDMLVYKATTGKGADDCAALAYAIAALRSPSPAQGMYSVEDIEGWLLGFTHNCLHTARDIHLRHEQFGIAAWKAKQLETQQEPRT